MTQRSWGIALSWLAILLVVTPSHGQSEPPLALLERTVFALPKVVFADSDLEKLDIEDPEFKIGFGVPIDGAGHILINDKSIDPPPKHIQVVLPARRIVAGKIIGRDSRTNLALIKIGVSEYPAPRHGNAAEIRAGDIVYARNASGENPTLIPARVNMPRGLFPRSDFLVDPMVEVKCLDSREDSLNSFRGPLFNKDGELIGSITLTGKSPDPDGSYRALAVRIDRLKRIAEDMRAFGKVRLPRLGTLVEQIPWDTSIYPGLTRAAGVQIKSLDQNGPAQRAGARIGDMVIELGGEPINSGADYTFTVQKLKPGERVEMHVLRKGEIHVFNVVTGEVISTPKP